MRLPTLLIGICLIILIPVSGFSTTSRDQEPVHSVQADFVQEKHLKILNRPIISTGTFAFQGPGSLRWEYLTPIPSILLLHNGNIRKFVKKDGNLREDRGIGLDAMQLMLGEISNWLVGRFTDNDIFTTSFPDKQTIILKPRGKSLAGLISKIELKPSEQKGVLDSVTIFEGSDSYTRMTFSNTVINKNIPDALFTGK